MLASLLLMYSGCLVQINTNDPIVKLAQVMQGENSFHIWCEHFIKLERLFSSAFPLTLNTFIHSFSFKTSTVSSEELLGLVSALLGAVTK